MDKRLENDCDAAVDVAGRYAAKATGRKVLMCIMVFQTDTGPHMVSGMQNEYDVPLVEDKIKELYSSLRVVDAGHHIPPLLPPGSDYCGHPKGEG